MTDVAIPHFYQCPLCASVFVQKHKQWQCTSGHSFDLAKQGYINLLPAHFKKSKQPGDDKAMVQTRQAFLNEGFYQPLKAAVEEVVAQLATTHFHNQKTHLLDIGCGEGYYTEGLANCVDRVTAIDISKAAVLACAKRRINNAQVMVASASQLPMVDECADIVTSIFSPILVGELARIVKSSGFLIVAKPMPTHLLQLREKLFEQVVLHNSDKFIEEVADSFSLHSQQEITFDIELDNQQLNNLMTMTPYAHRAKHERRVSVQTLDMLVVTVSFKLFVFTKVEL